MITRKLYWNSLLILRSEVIRAIKHTANIKAVGPDKVPAELFKTGGDSVIDRIHKISGRLVYDLANGLILCLSRFQRKETSKNAKTIGPFLWYRSPVRFYFVSF